MSENTVRKVDSLGRISIPKGMRDRFNINPNDEIEFSTCYNGEMTYICLNKKNDTTKAEIIAAELEALGIDPPDALLDMIS
jgi:AbrB family looped-hinge helix DNA binding protein